VKAVVCRSDVPSPALPFSAGIKAKRFHLLHNYNL